MGYLTRPTKSIDPRIVEKDLAQKQLEKLAVQPDSRGMFKKLVKANELESVDDEIRQLTMAIELSQDDIE